MTGCGILLTSQYNFIKHLFVFYLKGLFTERRDREDLPFIDSLRKWPLKSELSWSEAASEEIPRVSNTGSELKVLGHSLLLSQTTSRKLGQNEAASTWTSYLHMKAALVGVCRSSLLNLHASSRNQYFLYNINDKEIII